MRWVIAAAAFTLSPSPAWSYEVFTHSDMARITTSVSVLKQEPSLLNSIGLAGLSEAFPDSRNNLAEIETLIRDGAYFEDDRPRPLNHFFDPVNNRPLTIFGFSFWNYMSPDWALEDRHDIEAQMFSYWEGVEYFYKAMTSPARQERNRLWGMTFQTLGHVIHHVQDMAQPQHVRNDKHLDGPAEFFGIVPNPFYNPSRYESYTAKVSIKAGAYPVPTFPRVRDYWHNAAGQGLAQFTNRNFVSAGTNFTSQSGTLVSPLYQAPISTGETERLPAAEVWQAAGIDCLGPAPLPRVCGLNGTMAFYGNSVNDSYTGTATVNRRAASLSIFDQDFRLASGGGRVFALNRFNFDAAQAFLLQRAVAYGAGVIDHFFRGRLALERVVDDGADLIWEVKNVGAAENPMYNGAFQAFYDALDGTRKPLEIRGSGAVSLAAGEVLRLRTAKPPFGDLNFSGDYQLIVVFRGAIGAELGVAAAVGNMPLSGFILHPQYMPSDGIGGLRHIFFESGGWKLSQARGLSAGNIDWKGHYANGVPTVTLSWDGPEDRHRSASRNFNRLPHSFGSAIYQNGRIHAEAPLAVLGAAIRRDAEGEWLVAVCKDGLDDVVFERPNLASRDSALYHATAAPLGWREIARFVHSPYVFKEADSPWFFNGTGTEAQTMRNGYKDLGPGIGEFSWLYRLKINIGGGGASLSNEDNLAGVPYDWRESKQCQVDSQNADVDCSIDKCAVDSGSYYEEVTYRNEPVSASGEYIVAVDYIDRTPVYARLKVRSSGGEDYWSLSKGNSRGSCGGRSCPSWFYRSSQYTESRRTRVMDADYVLEIGPHASVYLSKSNGTVGTHFKTHREMQNDTMLVDINESSGIVDLNTVSTRLYYMDLRYGLYAAHVTERSYAYSGPADYAYMLPVQDTLKTKQIIGIGSQVLTLHDNAPVVRGPESAVFTLYNYRYGPPESEIACGAVEDNGYGGPVAIHLPSAVETSGAWAADRSGHVLLSQQREGDEPGVAIGGGFSVLSVGDLPALIPHAPSSPLYGGIRVVH